MPRSSARYARSWLGLGLGLGLALGLGLGLGVGVGVGAGGAGLSLEEDVIRDDDPWLAPALVFYYSVYTHENNPNMPCLQRIYRYSLLKPYTMF